MIDPVIVRIPRVYRFFADGNIRYMVIEYVAGQALSSLKDPNRYLEAVAKVIKQFK